MSKIPARNTETDDSLLEIVNHLESRGMISSGSYVRDTCGFRATIHHAIDIYQGRATMNRWERRTTTADDLELLGVEAGSLDIAEVIAVYLDEGIFRTFPSHYISNRQTKLSIPAMRHAVHSLLVSDNTCRQCSVFPRHDDMPDDRYAHVVLSHMKTVHDNDPDGPIADRLWRLLK